MSNNNEDTILKVENKKALSHTQITRDSKIDLETSEKLIKDLFDFYGENIPADEKVDISAAELANMVNIIINFSKIKITAVEMMKVTEFRVDNKVLLNEGVYLECFKLGVTTILDLVE